MSKSLFHKNSSRSLIFSVNFRTCYASFTAFNWSNMLIAACSHHTCHAWWLSHFERVTNNNYKFYCVGAQCSPCSVVDLVCGRGHAKDRRIARRRFLVGPADRASSSTWLTFCSCCSRTDYCFESCKWTPGLSYVYTHARCRGRIENAIVTWSCRFDQRVWGE